MVTSFMGSQLPTLGDKVVSDDDWGLTQSLKLGLLHFGCFRFPITTSSSCGCGDTVPTDGERGGPWLVPHSPRPCNRGLENIHPVVDRDPAGPTHKGRG